MLQCAYYDHQLTSYSDISEAFPNGEFAQLFRQDWLTQMARDTRGSKEFSTRTQETARWARDQIKRQSGKSYKSLEDVFLCR
jgi:hypothetical protein